MSGETGYAERLDNIIRNCKDEKDFRIVEEFTDSLKAHFSSRTQDSIRKIIHEEKARKARERQGILKEKKTVSSLDAVVFSLGALNSLCDQKNIERITSIDISRPDEVEAFVGECIGEILHRHSGQA